MELGGTFDDSLFVETKERNRDIDRTPYHVKICENQWYQNRALEDDPDDLHNVYKYRGDTAYYHGEYNKALTEYNKSLALVSATNVTTWRDIQESRARCLMYQGEKLAAEDVITQLITTSLNFEQKTSALYVGADIYRHFEAYQDELEMVRGLAALHTSNYDVWFRLADIYTKIQDMEQANRMQKSLGDLAVENNIDDTSLSESRNNKINRDSSTDTARIFTCLLRAKQLLWSVQNTTSAFAKTRLSKVMEKVLTRMKTLNVPEEMEEQCRTFLAGLRPEDDIVMDDSIKLEFQKKQTKQMFEKKWFSWWERSRDNEDAPS